MASTYIISDIHGHLIPLVALLSHIRPQPDDTVIALGDYIDRGPDTKGVLDTLLALRQKTHLITLLGNHEEMLLRARDNTGPTGDPAIINMWLINGGHEALASYDPSSIPAGYLAIPQSHWDFLAACTDYYETDSHIFVHAGVNPYLPMNQQDANTLRWQRFDDPPPHVSGKIVICGHTPQRSGFPRNIGHAVCLDTGVHVGRFLTCLKLPENQILQSSPTGQLRSSTLASHLTTPTKPQL